MSLLPPLAVQSYCFRQFSSNEEVARLVRRIGLDRVELCAVHANFDDPAAFADVVEIYRREGVQIVSLGVQTFEGEARERAWFECAAAAGATHLSAHVRVDSFGRALARMRGWAQEFGVRVGLHCHGGYMFGGQPDVLDHLLALGGPEVGLCIDTAWALQIGPNNGNPVEWAKRYAGRITGVHLKDFVFGRDGKWTDVVVGTGNLDLPAFAAGLREGGFDGVAIVEYEGDPEDPAPALTECVAAIRSAAR